MRLLIKERFNPVSLCREQEVKTFILKYICLKLTSCYLKPKRSQPSLSLIFTKFFTCDFHPKGRLYHGSLGFPWWLNSKESACQAEDLGLIPGWGRAPHRGHGNPLVFLPGESPGTEEPGGLQSMGSHRVRHD